MSSSSTVAPHSPVDTATSEIRLFSAHVSSSSSASENDRTAAPPAASPLAPPLLLLPAAAGGAAAACEGAPWGPGGDGASKPEGLLLSLSWERRSCSTRRLSGDTPSPSGVSYGGSAEMYSGGAESYSDVVVWRESDRSVAGNGVQSSN